MPKTYEPRALEEFKTGNRKERFRDSIILSGWPVTLITDDNLLPLFFMNPIYFLVLIAYSFVYLMKLSQSKDIHYGKYGKRDI